MEDSNKIIIGVDNNPINFGRKPIILNYDEVTPENFMDVFNDAKPIFEENQRDCFYLIDMYLGKQDILNRPAPNTSNINNKTVINYAFPTTREIVGYTFGNPFEYIANDNKYKKDVSVISDVYNYENSYAIDTHTATYASICGIGYEITLPASDITKDNTPDVPIISSALDPRFTFVVQSTGVGNPQIMSGMEIRDSKNTIIKYICFTNKYKFTLSGPTFTNLEVEKNPIGLDPITPFENSLLLTGDWEQAIPVMNAINQLTSDSLNDVEGTIKSLLVILGTDITDASTTLSTIKDKRLLSLFNANGSGNSIDAKFISPQLDSQEVKELRSFLSDAKNIITGIPDRQTNGAASGDTGVAVINRNGWTDIEIVAKLKELLFKKGKKRQLAIMIAILKKLDLVSDSLRALDVDVTLGRNTLDNLSTKASAFATLVATGELATIDALDFSGLTNRTNEVVARGEAAKKEREKQAQISQNSNENLPNTEKRDTINTDKGNNKINK